ncbi:MAG: acetyl-CoA decarbonylase/synthase complex subunit gamma [Candidatus Bathyarchaeota archaeon]|nr:acetyl-CoA decarbonylase/synthase complex subunit gamma [Candidatus Bathyarchaeota archaeon]
MSEKEASKMGAKELSPIDVYMLLPRTNCKKCGQENCMAFATKLVNRELALELCTPLLEEKQYAKAYRKLWDLLKPPVKEVTVGAGDSAIKIGGKFVMYRHELMYANPTAIAIDVTDEMPERELFDRLKKTDGFSYTYIGRELKLDMIAVRSTSNDPKTFKAAVKKVTANTDLPLMLCSFNSEVIEAGLMAAPKTRPLLYAATDGNWKDMAELSLMYDCPLTVFAPGNLKLLRSLVKTLLEYGVKDLVLDPGTFPLEGIAETVVNLTMIRRMACKRGDELFGFPIIGTPIVTWTQKTEAPEISMWNEAYLASILITRYADILTMHSTEGWVLLPNAFLRENLYTDPRKPVAVEPGLREFGEPDEASPVMLTTNFALTYYTVASDIESAGLNCYLIVADTEGHAVDTSVAGRKLTAENIAEAIKVTQVEKKVKHRKLIIPGKAARLSGEIQELSSWEVLVGPRDSSEIPKYLSEKW